MNRAAPRAICRHEYADALKANVRSVIGYQAEARGEHHAECDEQLRGRGPRACMCGASWDGPWRGTYDEARRDARERNTETAAA